MSSLSCPWFKLEYSPSSSIYANETTASNCMRCAQHVRQLHAENICRLYHRSALKTRQSGKEKSLMHF